MTKHCPPHEISKQKAYTILAVMGFKPMTLSQDFPAYEISKKEVIKFWL